MGLHYTHRLLTLLFVDVSAVRKAEKVAREEKEEREPRLTKRRERLSLALRVRVSRWDICPSFALSLPV